MTREEAIKRLKEARNTIQPFLYVDEAIDYAVKVLEQEPCEDCVSRQTAIDELELQAKEMSQWSERYTEQAKGVLTAKNIIKDLPSVTPQSKTGKWILKRTFPTKLYDGYIREYECSECHRIIRCTESQLVNYPYSRCGAKMIEPQESKSKESD